MKKGLAVTLAFSGCFYVSTLFAQVLPASSAEEQRPAPKSTTSITRHTKLNALHTSTGRTYNNSELLRMPVRDINHIANTVVGVDSRSGAVPNIRGAAASGTAYFVDGVRVYGALPH